MGWEKIIDIFSWLKDKLPIADRLEKIKNDIAKLEKEKKELLNAKSTIKTSKRLTWIDDRLDTLNKRLQNATSSS